MTANNDNRDGSRDFVALLGEVERLSRRLEAFLQTHDDPQSADVLFALADAKDAAERAATALRAHVRRPS